MLLVSIKSTGGKAMADGRLEFKIDDEVKAISTFTINENSQVVDTITFSTESPGWHRASLSIIDYPVTFDDTYYFTFNIKEKIKVLNIYEQNPNKYFNAFFANIAYFDYKQNTINSINYGTFDQYQLVILDALTDVSSGLANQLKNYLKRGGNVIIAPAINSNINSYNKLFSELEIPLIKGLEDRSVRVGSVNLEEYIYKDVFDKMPRNMDFPQAQYRYIWDENLRSGTEDIMLFEDDKSFITKYSVQNGKVYFLATPLGKEYGNFATHSLFVPFLYKVAVAGNASNIKSYIIGSDEEILVDVNENDKAIPIKIANDQAEFIPLYRQIDAKAALDVKGQLQTAGFYQYYLDNKNDGGWLSFNYDRKESILDFYDDDELEKLAVSKGFKVLDITSDALQQKVSNINTGIILWKICLLLALLFLIAEVVLLRLWK